MVIGVFGATIKNHNLGCQALAWSLFAFLEKISKQIQKEFKYIVFDRRIDKECNDFFMNQFGISADRIEFVLGSTPKLYKIRQNTRFCNYINKCDVVIDLTQGDSFTDIYGFKRFITWTAEKLIVQNKGVPLILGPQTYGPFKHKTNFITALKVINKSYAVFSRDDLSTRYLEEKCNKNIVTGIDLAFLLPYNKVMHFKTTKIRVGINPSGLLWDNYNKKYKKVNIEYKTDYCQYLKKLISQMISSGNYEIHMIPHVSTDDKVIAELCMQFPELIHSKIFENAIEAKSYISSLDCFIGTRMHATIAAMSSGVPVIPVSYSRKFEGLYSSINYNHVISLTEFITEEAVKQTMEKLENLDILNNDKIVSLRLVEERMKFMIDKMANVLKSL